MMETETPPLDVNRVLYDPRHLPPMKRLSSEDLAEQSAFRARREHELARPHVTRETPFPSAAHLAMWTDSEDHDILSVTIPIPSTGVEEDPQEPEQIRGKVLTERS